MSFDVAADAYDRFMGHYSVPLAPKLADLAGVEAGMRVLDVGCGPGALTTELVRRLGPGAVAAVDPSLQFVDAVRERLPDVSVRRAVAEELPFEDAAFDAALAQLVVHFMTDPVAGLREMSRVARPGGVVCVCVWDHGGGRGPVSTYWDAVRELYPDAEDESLRPGSREGHLAELAREAGLTVVEVTALPVSVEYATFEEWWEPFTLGVGPAGSFSRSLDAGQLERLREACRERIPAEPFAQTVFAWAVKARP
jgi:SAM-dependent methyltransferase